MLTEEVGHKEPNRTNLNQKNMELKVDKGKDR